DAATCDAASEGEELRGAEALGQTSVAGEDDREQLPRIEVFAGEQAQLAEHGGWRLLCLISEQHGARKRGGDMLAPARAKSLEATPSVMSGERDSEDVAELAIEVRGTALRPFHGADDRVGKGAQAAIEQAQHDTLAGARIAGDHRKAAVGDPELDATEEGVDGERGEERVERDVRAEGIEFQPIEREKAGTHWDSSSSRMDAVFL